MQSLLAQASSLHGKYGLPPDISTHGHAIDSMMTWIHLFMAVLFVGWGVFFLFCLIRFRARPGHTAFYGEVKAKPSKYAEIVVVGIETVLLVFFSIPIWRAYKNEPPPASDNPMSVRVVAQQFAWNFHYAGSDGKFGKTDPKNVDEQTNAIGLDRSDPNAKDDVVLLNQLYIPVNRPVIARITSKDVIHSFWIPVMRVKQDTIPGMEIPIWFQAKETGKHDVACAQLCGLNHYSMRGFINITTQEEFDKYMVGKLAEQSEDEDDLFGEEEE